MIISWLSPISEEMNDKYLGFRICNALRCKFNLPKRFRLFSLILEVASKQRNLFLVELKSIFLFCFCFCFLFLSLSCDFPLCAVHIVVKTKFHVGVWPTSSKNYTKMSACSTIFFPHCVNNKMLEHDWLLESLIYTLIGCFRYMPTVQFDLCDYECLSFAIVHVKLNS